MRRHRKRPKIESIDRYHATSKEDDLEATIAEAVGYLHGKCWHARDSRGMNLTDMPDLVIVVPGFVAFVELKSQKRALTAGQIGALALIGTTCAWVGVVRPVPEEGEYSLDQFLAILNERRTL